MVRNYNTTTLIGIGKNAIVRNTFIKDNKNKELEKHFVIQISQGQKTVFGIIPNTTFSNKKTLEDLDDNEVVVLAGPRDLSLFEKGGQPIELTNDAVGYLLNVGEASIVTTVETLISYKKLLQYFVNLQTTNELEQFLKLPEYDKMNPLEFIEDEEAGIFKGTDEFKLPLSFDISFVFTEEMNELDLVQDLFKRNVTDVITEHLIYLDNFPVLYTNTDLLIKGADYDKDNKKYTLSYVLGDKKPFKLPVSIVRLHNNSEHKTDIESRIVTAILNNKINELENECLDELLNANSNTET